MKQSNILLLAIVIFSMVTVVQAQGPQYETVSKMAEDVDCSAVCHAPDPHQIHAGTSATCQQCHGATLTDRQPQCTKCHSGTIHNVHIKKVQTEDCSYCHKGLESLHSDMMSDTLCSHCHDDLLDVHGGDAESCNKCHGKAPDIVAPIKAVDDVIVCQNCHISADVAALHGEASNLSSCYRCHRPGSSDVESSSEIPHFLHIPEVNCNRCHLNQDTGKIYIPLCTQCHKVESLHSYDAVGLKTSGAGTLRCSVCHPMSDAEDSTTTTSTKASPAAARPTEETAADSGGSGLPGFGVLSAITALSVLFVMRRSRN
ncbi:MAG: cytochrome c3 family protein [ANME-2 cluster archaeon]|nr:cytochrome c3 family protein [ANME-2 cluster archaeon]